MKIQNPLPSKIHRTVWHYKNADFQAINDGFRDAPWDLAFTTFDDIDDILDYYYDIIYESMERHIPKREIIKSKHDKPWMNGFLHWLLRLRNRWNGTYDRTLNPRHKATRNKIRSMCKREMRYAKRQYYARLKNDLSSNQISPKKFWSIMKELYGAKVKDTIPTMIENDVAYTTDLDKANLFGTFFAQTCSLPPPPTYYRLPPVDYKTDQRLTTIDMAGNSCILKFYSIEHARTFTMKMESIDFNEKNIFRSKINSP